MINMQRELQVIGGAGVANGVDVGAAAVATQ